MFCQPYSCSPSPLPPHHSQSAPSYVDSNSRHPYTHPVRLPHPSPTPFACVYCGKLGHSVWHFHKFTYPALQILHRLPHYRQLLLICYLYPQGHPCLVTPTLILVPCAQESPTIPQVDFPLV